MDLVAFAYQQPARPNGCPKRVLVLDPAVQGGLQKSRVILALLTLFFDGSLFFACLALAPGNPRDSKTHPLDGHIRPGSGNGQPSRDLQWQPGGSRPWEAKAASRSPRDPKKRRWPKKRGSLYFRFSPLDKNKICPAIDSFYKQQGKMKNILKQMEVSFLEPVPSLPCPLSCAGIDLQPWLYRWPMAKLQLKLPRLLLRSRPAPRWKQLLGP